MPVFRTPTIVRSVLLGMVIMFVGTMPRNVLFVLNLRFYSDVPWAVPLTTGYLWVYWRYLSGASFRDTTSCERRTSLRANRVPLKGWMWSFLAGGTGIVALVIALRILNRMVVLPNQQLPDFSHVSRFTVLSLLLAAAPVAGIVEESSFRGYMQGPIERRHGLVVAILITGTMFAVAHLDFTLMLWPYYVAVAAIYGVITHLTNSIFPSMALHTAGNTYSNLDLWLSGHSEWQTAAGSQSLIWNTGTDAAFWRSIELLVAISAISLWAFFRLARCLSRGETGVARG